MATTAQIGQGLLSNPLLGLGIGLLGGASPGGTFGSGAQQGLQNMMLMQGQNQRNKAQELTLTRMKAQMAEDERLRTLNETMRAQNPEWLGSPAQAAQPAEMAPYMQSEGEMFPGEQPIGGLMDQTAPAQVAQDASGLHAQNPQLGGLMSDMYQANPLQTTGLMAKSTLSQKPGQFGFNEYMNASDETRQMYDSYKGWDDENQPPSNVQEWQYYNQLDPTQQAEYRRMKRANQYIDVGTGYVNPDAPQGAPTLDTTAPVPPGGQSSAAPAMVRKDIIGTAVQKAEGGDIGERLTSYGSDMRVAEDMLSSIEETQGQLAQLFGKTNYSTTGIGSLLKDLPTSDARSWDNLKTTLLSRMGLDRLLEMKASSPTGASGFGALSQKELELLVANLGRLDNADDPAEIKRTILSINRQLGDKAKVMTDRMDKQRAWYETNKSRLSDENRTGDSEIIDWNDLPQ